MESIELRYIMDIIRAAESNCKARMDEHAYIMNICYQVPEKDNIDKFMNSLANYTKAFNELRVLESFKSQASEGNNEIEDNAPSN